MNRYVPFGRDQQFCQCRAASSPGRVCNALIKNKATSLGSYISTKHKNGSQYSEDQTGVPTSELYLYIQQGPAVLPMPSCILSWTCLQRLDQKQGYIFISGRGQQYCRCCTASSPGRICNALIKNKATSSHISTKHKNGSQYNEDRLGCRTLAPTNEFAYFIIIKNVRFLYLYFISAPWESWHRFAMAPGRNTTAKSSGAGATATAPAAAVAHPRPANHLSVRAGKNIQNLI